MSARSSRGIFGSRHETVADGERIGLERYGAPRGRRARSIDRADLDALDSIPSRCGAHAVAEMDRHARSADRHGPARSSHREARPPQHARQRGEPIRRTGEVGDRGDLRLPRRAPWTRPAAAAARSRQGRCGRPGSMPCDLIRMVAAARPITPGSVQPGKGTTRSYAPVAAISRGAVNASWPPCPATSTRKPLATDQTRQPKRSVIAESRNAAAQVIALRAVRVGLRRKAARRRAIDLSACRDSLVDQQHRQAVPRSRQRGAAACRPGADHDQVERGRHCASPAAVRSQPRAPPRPAPCRIGAARRRSAPGTPGTHP